MSLCPPVSPLPAVVNVSHGESKPLIISIMGGAVAGMSVDIILYPLDTLKTRLQSQYGFWNSGGFKGIYKGIGPTSIGSPISAGLFFGSYELVKNMLSVRTSEKWYPCIHMLSASLAEIVCCAAKVPMEIVKQRRQASRKNLSAVKILFIAVSKEGIYGLYRGYNSTILRDVPFSIIEFPVWEWLKIKWTRKVNRELTTTEVAFCGSIAGGVAATITTPLDVVKTQIMLAENNLKNTADQHIFSVMRNIYQKHGITKLFAGFLPRLSMIMFGGGVFFGVYEKCCQLIKENFTIF